MDLPAAVERDDDLVAPAHDRYRVAFQEESCRQQRDAHSGLAEETTELPEIRVHQGFATGENDPTRVESSQIFHVRRQLLGGDLPFLCVGLPDIAHDTATVTGAVRHEDHHRKGPNSVGCASQDSTCDLGRVLHGS